MTPSKDTERAMRQHLKEEGTRLAGCNVGTIVGRLNPLLRGWATYVRSGGCSPTFNHRDHWMHHREKWYARKRHPSKPTGWRRRGYWSRLKPGRADRWVFGDTRRGVYLRKFGGFRRHKHALVRGTAAPDAPRLRDYGTARKAQQAQTLTPSRRKLAATRSYVCRVCGDALLNGEELHEHHSQPRGHGGDTR